MTEWSLAVDFGTTFTTAAMVVGDTVTIIELDGSAKIPSAVALDDEGELVVGLASGDEAGWAPDRVERNPKRSLGRTKHLVLDGQPIPVARAVGALLRAIADEGMRRRNGEAPAKLVLTHPVRWSSTRVAELAAAATAVGLPDPVLVPEPVAAAMHYLDERIVDGDLVAVYDLGGGTFDTAVLRRTDTGFDLAGEPGGNADLGGERLDDLLYGLVGSRLAQSHPELWDEMTTGETPAGRRQAAEVRRDARRAKEALSRQQYFTMHVAAAGSDLRITRPEFEALVTAPLRDTVDELAATIERCDVEPSDVAAIYLVGGASRTPLVSRLVSERFGDLPATFDDPKSVVVLGAARLVRESGVAVPEMAPEPTTVSPTTVYRDAPTTPPVGTPTVAMAAASSTPPAPSRSRPRWMLPVAVAALTAALVGGGVAFVAPSLASQETPVPAAATVPAPAPVVAPAPVTTTTTAEADPTTAARRTTTTTPRPTSERPTTTKPKTSETTTSEMEEEPLTNPGFPAEYADDGLGTPLGSGY
ncbi:Hsp70 family protein [Actinomycetospora sp. CA-053990]|uniref:Hsp70 family protein n=1 Tax=Actinomycetospora sp. CA-053990 TaxID=3239891 RepID=UPI003D8B8AE1